MSHVRIQVSFDDGTDMEVTEEFGGDGNPLYKASAAASAIMAARTKLNKGIVGMYGDITEGMTFK